MIRKTLVKKVKIINLRKKMNEPKKKKIDNIKGVIKKKKTFISLSSICFLTAIWKEDEFNQGFFSYNIHVLQKISIFKKKSVTKTLYSTEYFKDSHYLKYFFLLDQILFF